MLDRVPTKPNRYAVYDDSHTLKCYEYHERADDPTTEGTTLSKANLLPDAVAAAINALMGSTPTTPGEALNMIVSAFSNRAKIAAGTYTGTGTYGSANPNTLNFNFVPKIILVHDYDQSYISHTAFLFNPSTRAEGFPNSATSEVYQWHVSWSGNSVSWYQITKASYQYNESGNVYYYVALG